MSNIRTYEIVSKWIADECGVAIVFQPNIKPKCDAKNKVIYLPNNIKDSNVLAAIATVMHEAGHMKHSAKIDKEKHLIIRDELDFQVLNSLEDVRINQIMFGKLPNATQFFQIMYDKLDLKGLASEYSLEDKALFECMMEEEGFGKRYSFKEDAVRKIVTERHLDNLFYHALHRLNDYNHRNSSATIHTIKDSLHKLRDALYGPPKQDKQQPQPQQQQGQQQQDQKNGNAQGEGGGKGTPQQQCDGQKTNGGQSQSGQDEESGAVPTDGKVEEVWGSITDQNGVTGARMCGRGVFETAEIPSATSTEVGSVAYDEITKARFKEALQVKNTQFLEGGNILDTENLLAFFTEDIDELFIDEIEEKKVKSKIYFLLDASCSMGNRLMCKTPKYKALIAAVKGLLETIEEIKDIEGINLDYEIRGFDGRYYKYDKATWHNEYGAHGGTNILNAFRECMKEIVNDYDVDGKKMMLVFSDGDVEGDQIDQMKKEIMEKSGEIRVLIVGIGTDINGHMEKEIVGENNIISTELSNDVMYRAVETLLS